MQYDHLPASERANILRARITGLERDHFNVNLDVRTAGANGNPGQTDRLAELEKTIAELKTELSGLESKGS